LLAGIPEACSAKSRSKWRKAWLAAVGTLVAANAIDIHSSGGLSETNPLLRNSNGYFSSRKGIIVKSAASGGFLLLEVILLKKAPDRNLYKPFAITNLVAAGVVAAMAARNYSIPRTPAPEYLRPD
jgi:hypothetical protein